MRGKRLNKFRLLILHTTAGREEVLKNRLRVFVNILSSAEKIVLTNINFSDLTGPVVKILKYGIMNIPNPDKPEKYLNAA